MHSRGGRTPVGTPVHRRRATSAERQALVPEGEVLGDGLVVAVAVGDVQVGEVIGVEEEHVGVLVEVLEAGGVVWEPKHAGISKWCALRPKECKREAYLSPGSVAVVLRRKIHWT